MSVSTHPVWARYGVAVLAIAVATALRVLVDPLIGDRFPFALLFLAILVAAGYGGYGPALTAMVCGALISAALWISLATETGQLGLAFYVLVGLGIAWLGGLMWSASRQAEERQQSSDVELRKRQEMESSLRSSEARKAAVVNMALDAVITMDHEGRIVEFNPAAEQILGFRRSDVIGKDMAELIIPPKMREQHRHGLAHFLETGAGPILKRRIELTALRADGTELPVELAITPIASDGPPLFTGYLRDITERQQQETELNERVRLAAFGRDVGLALTHGESLHDMLQHCTDAIASHLDAAFARIWTLNEAENVLHLAASSGMYTHLDGPHSRVPVGQFKIGLIAEQQKPHLTNSVIGDPRVHNQQWAKQQGMVAFAGYPLLIEDRVVGVMALFARHVLTQATLEAMASVANGIAVGIERKRSEERLHDQREWLRVTLASIGDAVIATDTQGRITFLNNLAQQLTGWKQEEAEGKSLETVFQIINERTREPAENPVHKVLHQGSVIGLANHTLLIGKDGTEYPIDDSAAPIRDSHGNVLGVVMVFRDVTERRQAERAVHEEKRLVETLHRIGSRLSAELDLDTLLQTLTDETTALTDAQFGAFFYNVLNEHGEAYTPYTLSGAPASALAEFPMPRNTAVFEPTFRGQGVVRVDDITQDPRYGQNAPHQAMPDGHLPVRSYLAVPVNSRSGEVLGGLFFGHSEAGVFDERDEQIMTGIAAQAAVAIDNARLYQQKRAAGERLARQAARQRSLADAALTINAAQSLESVLQVITREARQIIGAHQAVSSMTLNEQWAQAVNTVSLSEKYADWSDYDAQPDGSGIYSLVCRTNQPMRLTQAELEAHSDWKGFGKEVSNHPPMNGWLAAPFIGFGGRNLGLIQLSDKTDGQFTEEDESILIQLAAIAAVAIEKTRLFEDLRDSDRRKDEFLAVLAHELRNPLAPIRNGLQVLKMTEGDQTIATDIRDMMERQVQQMVHLVDDLLDVSRISRGKIELRRLHVDLKSIVRSALETSRPLIEEKNHQLSVTMPPEPIPMYVDETRLAQVVSNLLNNSAKYTEPGGNIQLAVEFHNDQIAIRVKDTGIGIPADMLPSVFDMFTQVSDSLQRAPGGLGIGLTLVKNLVELHDGRIEADSAGVGRGSEFVVWLPRSAAAARTEAQASSQWEDNKPSDSQRRVLVVDDNHDSAQSLATLLTLMGQQVRVVYDGKAALAEAEQFLPDVLFLDIGMPGMSGYEVARRIRNHHQLGETLLVATTGWGQDEDRRRSKAAGFDHHLVKPVQPETLEKLISTTEG